MCLCAVFRAPLHRIECASTERFDFSVMMAIQMLLIVGRASDSIMIRFSSPIDCVDLSPFSKTAEK
jgi:hypothetical protein